MPPKPKFTRDEILARALDVVRAEGEAALTARRLGDALGTSSRPIFTLFEGMDDLKAALREPAMEAFSAYCDGFGDFKPAFKRFGMMLVSFATLEPNLFTFLFCSKHGEPLTLEEWSGSRIGDEARAVLKRDYVLEDEDAKALFVEVWTHTFAICVLKATGAVKLSDQDVSDTLSRNFISMLSMAKAGRLRETGINPLKGAMEDGNAVSDAPIVPILNPIA